MANDALVTLSSEQTAQMEKNQADIKKVLDNKQVMIDTGVFTKDQIEDMQVTYDSSKKLLERFRPKK
jgi:hypothetical protein